MGNMQLLKRYIEESGKDIDQLAQLCNISKMRFSRLISGKDEFKASEMQSLSEILGLSGDMSEMIFFDFRS